MKLEAKMDRASCLVVGGESDENAHLYRSAATTRGAKLGLTRPKPELGPETRPLREDKRRGQPI